MSEIRICDMTISDLKQLEQNLYNDFDDFWTIQNFKSELENPNSRCFIAKTDDEIVGFASIWKAVDDVHITNIVTRKNLRGKGIGSILLEHLINVGKSYDNITSITLEVNYTNQPAINLYKKYDFKQVGIRKKYYSRNR